MANNYVATIMDRIFLGDDNFIFLHSFTTIGSYDPTSHIFKDRNGLEYYPITEPMALKSEVTRGFNNLAKLDDLPKLVGQERIKDAISEYDELCSRFLCYVSFTNDGMIFAVPIDYMAMREHINQTVGEINKHGGIEKAADEKTVIPYPKNNEQEESDENSQESLFGKPLPEEVGTFIMEIMNGKYSIDDLKAMKELLTDPTKKVEKKPTEREEQKKEVSPKQPIKNRVDIEKVFKAVTKTLIAQDDPARRVITEIARKTQNPASKKRGILITGQSGCGKTKMMELIAKYIDIPFIKIDATQLTIPGYVGKDIETELWRLFVLCGKDKKKAENAIVYFEEIDKKGSDSKGDISGRGVLNTLLPFFDGTTYDATPNTQYKREVVQLSTDNMYIILGGAFEDVYRTKGDDIGFVSGAGKTNSKQATTDDFVEKAGMPREFMRRVAVVKLNDLDVEEIRRILFESDESALLIQKKLFDELGVKLTVGEDFIDEVVKRAVKKKTGASGLDTVMEEATWEAYNEASTKPGEYEEMILTRETVDNPKQYTKIPRQRSAE